MKILLRLSILLFGLGVATAHAQTPATIDQQTQNTAGFIVSCATVNPLVGWKFITISLDRANAQQMSIKAYATMGNNSAKKIVLCDKQQAAQAMIDMLNLTSKGKPIAWQSLLFRSAPNRQFTFTPLTLADVNAIAQSTVKP